MSTAGHPVSGFLLSTESICPSVHPPTLPPVHSSVCPFTYSSIHPPTDLPILLYTCLFIHQSIHSSIYSSIHPATCLSTCPSTCPVHLSVCHHSNTYLLIYLSVIYLLIQPFRFPTTHSPTLPSSHLLTVPVPPTSHLSVKLFILHSFIHSFLIFF